jgi:hypothetical protein
MSANTNSSYNYTVATTRAVTRSQSKSNSNIRLLCPPKQSIGLKQFLKEQKNKRTNNITLTCEEKDTSKPPSLLLPEEAGYKPEATFNKPEATFNTPKIKKTFNKPNATFNKPNAILEEINKPAKKNNTLKKWFVKYIKEMLYNLDIVNAKKNLIRGSFGTGNNSKKEVDFKKEHYDSLRIVIEIYFNINEYLPELIREHPISFNKFTKDVYNKIQELYKSIHNMESFLYPKTDEEYDTIRSIVQVLEDAEKTVIQYLPTEKHLQMQEENLLPLLLPNKKRNRKPVDYTGMDTIEPYDEYDAITDIWYDKSLAYDSDYVPEEDDDDDDDDEELEDDEALEDDDELEDELEDEDNYSESEDYVDEEEDEEELEQDALEEAELLKFSVNKEPKKVYKSANHIVFEYDD